MARIDRLLPIGWLKKKQQMKHLSVIGQPGILMKKHIISNKKVIKSSFFDVDVKHGATLSTKLALGCNSICKQAMARYLRSVCDEHQAVAVWNKIYLNTQGDIFQASKQ